MAKEETVWSKGLWFLPVLTFFGGVFFFVRAWKSHVSGSTITGTHGEIIETGNIPLGQLGFFWFAVVLFAATIGILIAVNRSK